MLKTHIRCFLDDDSSLKMLINAKKKNNIIVLKGKTSSSHWNAIRIAYNSTVNTATLSVMP